MNKPKDYQRYLSLSSELFCTLELDGNIDGLVGPWEVKMNQSADQLIGSNIFSVIHPDDLIILKAGISDLQKTKRSFSSELRIKNSATMYSYYDVKVIAADAANLTFSIEKSTCCSSLKGKTMPWLGQSEMANSRFYKLA